MPRKYERLMKKEGVVIQTILKKGVWLSCPEAEGGTDQLNPEAFRLRNNPSHSAPVDKKIEAHRARQQNVAGALECRELTHTQCVCSEHSQFSSNMLRGCTGHPQQGLINPAFVPISPNTHRCKVNSWTEDFHVLCNVLFERIRSDIWEEESIWLGWAQEAQTNCKQAQARAPRLAHSRALPWPEHGLCWWLSLPLMQGKRAVFKLTRFTSFSYNVLTSTLPAILAGAL